MWNTWLNSSTIPALEQTTAFAEKRHMLLAGNIANLDTPDYQSRDLSVDNFQDALKDLITEKPAHTSRSPSQLDPIDRVRDTSRQILYHDGSDVSLEEQVTELSKNQAKHNTAIALMRSQFQTLKMAIRESVNV